MSKHAYINSGWSRKVFQSKFGNVLKIALPERIEAGIMQNQNEYEILSGFADKYSCFPKAIRKRSDYSVIEVEQCMPVNGPILNDNIYEFYNEVGNLVVCASSSSSFKRLDEYANIPIANSFYRWFAFIFGHVLNTLIADLPKNSKSIDINIIVDIAIDLLNKLDSKTSNAEYVLQFAKFIEYLRVNNAKPICKSLIDFIEFYMNIGYSRGILFADMWNDTQWGISNDGRLMVIDIGYTCDMANSEHFIKVKIEKNDIITNEPGVSPNTFNGRQLCDIYSPNGNPIKYKFYTLSEYILSEDNMSRHIKHQNKDDDGLWDWSSKTVFVEHDNLFKFIDTISKMNKLTAIKVEFNNNQVILYQHDYTGKWAQVASIEYQLNPCIGLHVCEFYLDQFDGKSGIIKSYHPGHAVNFIENIFIKEAA